MGFDASGIDFKPRGGVYFFPERLRKRLSMIWNHPVTVAEAPSGFGKTTAIREFLKNSPDVRVDWHTCLGEPPAKTWQGICRLLGNADIDIARELKELYPPTMETLADIAALMRAFRAEEPACIVIDNYQLFENAIPNELIDAFSVHGSPGLRVVFITQPLPFSLRSVHNANIYRLTAKDFFFDRDSTSRLCLTYGITLSGQELDDVQHISKGWISAIRLQVDNYKETGSFRKTVGMEELIETAVWNRLDQEEREFFLSVSLLDGFTLKQAAVMGGWNILPDGKRNLIESNFFIPYVADKGVFSIHDVLRNYLRRRLDEQSSAFIDKMRRRAGEACMTVSDYFGAGRFFLFAKDYDAVLSIPFTPLYMSDIKEKNVIGLIEQVLDECDEDALLRYPFAVLRFAYQFLQSGRRERFSKMVYLLRKFSVDSVGLSDEAFFRIRSELALLMAFTAYNDIERMSEYHREALSWLSRLKEKSSASGTVAFGTTPWTFGTTSVLFMFWRDVGELDRELALMDERLPYYTRLTGGHGTGAEYAFRASAALMRGYDGEAEVLSHKALYLALGENQKSICLCAELILGRVAVLRGDETMYALARKNIEKYAGEPGRALFRMTELCAAALDLIVGAVWDFPEWLRETESIRNVLHVQGHSYGFMLHGKILLQEKRWAELYALSDLAMTLAREMHYLLPQLYHRIYLAVAKAREGKLFEAMPHLIDALGIALPDRVYLPFAEFGDEMSSLLKTAEKDFGYGDFGHVLKGDTQKIDEIIALCKRQSSGATKITGQTPGARLALTPREREIALLVKERHGTREIASRLFITENTVRSTLKTIFRKLNAHSRRELEGKIF